MADIKISQLGAAVAVVDADVIPATANGVTVKVPASVLKEYAIGGTDISSIGDGTPTGAISALKSVKIEKTDIAPIETSVASKAYAVGDQLYYNGMLYSVIAAIAQGETLVVDTNIELSDKVTEQIKALNGEVSTLNEALTNVKDSVTSIDITGSTNNTGSDIASGTFFYLNGALVKAKTNIANGATLTLNTNYKLVTAGGLNALNSALNDKQNADVVSMFGRDDKYTKKLRIYAGNYTTNSSGRVLLDIEINNFIRCTVTRTSPGYTVQPYVGSNNYVGVEVRNASGELVKQTELALNIIYMEDVT